MVKYSIEAINAFLNPIERVPGRPNFSSLWLLAEALSDALQKLDHPNHPTDGWAGCIMTKEEFSLQSTQPWRDPETVGKYFVMPTAAISIGNQEQAKGEYKYKRDLLDTHEMIMMSPSAPS